MIAVKFDPIYLAQRRDIERRHGAENDGVPVKIETKTDKTNRKQNKGHRKSSFDSTSS